MMIVGVPREIKVHEYRVGLVPAGVRELVAHGHAVLVQAGAGMGIGLSDADYEAAGGQIVDSAADVFEQADLVVKVKDPEPGETKHLREGQVLFTYLHLAANPALTDALRRSNCLAIGYETVTDGRGGLPLLAPMSEVAGRMAVQVGAHHLEKEQGGRGVLLAGVPGVLPASVVIVGGGVSGANAARMAIGQQARVTVIDNDLNKLDALDRLLGRELDTLYSTADHIEAAVAGADLVIGCVLRPGASAPKLVTREMIRKMHSGGVLVDVAIDQGGCFETSRPTTHADPIYLEEGCIHYCVTNMPGAVARTSTFALTNATLRFVLDLADKGPRRAMAEDNHLMHGLNVAAGQVTHRGVARSLDQPYTAPQEALGI
jgi:alanine dehydrogenase